MAPPSIARHGPGASTAWYRGRAFTRLLLGGVLCLLALVYLSASSSSAASRFRQASRPYYRPWSSGSHVRTPKPKATFVVLVREHELHDVLLTLKEIQVAFNDDVGTGYDFVFLSDTTFTDYFKLRVETFLAHRPSKPRVRWGFVEDKDWKMPEHIDYYRAQAAMEVMGKSNLIPYGGSQTYRQMCRYMSYPIFEHPLVMEYDYYWRLEPHTRHFCDLTSAYEDGQWVERDPFRYMRDNGKKYAWVLSLLEYKTTVRTLMVHVHRWRDANRHLIPEQSSFDFISDDGKAYNLCHFWSNFEIVDLSFYRSEAYRSFFHSLDRAGGFFYERWGDAPVHTIGAAMLLRPDEIWKVDWAGYTHPPYMTCPRDAKLASRCACDPQASFEYDRSNCEAKWDKLQGRNSTEIILDINRQRGVPEQNWTKENPVRVLPPQRLIKPPSQAKV